MYYVLINFFSPLAESSRFTKFEVKIFYMKKFYAFFITLIGLTSLSTSAQTYYSLANKPFKQDWNDTSLFTANNAWPDALSIIGYRGDNLAKTGASPDTILRDGSKSPINITRNYKNSTVNTGGIGEFEIANPTIALLGSSTADAPHIVIYLNTVGVNFVRAKYKLRDIDGTVDTATQKYALQYKVGTDTIYKNISDAFVADATSGPEDSSKITDINVVLPTECANQEKLELRIMTINAAGSDEWVGIDDIEIFNDPTASVSNVSLKKDDFRISNANSNGIFNVQFLKSFERELSLQILDMSGKLIVNNRIKNAITGQLEKIDLSKELSGVYILRIQSKDGIYSTKLVK